MTRIAMSDHIQTYWNERAGASGQNPNATTNDVHFRELEIRTLADALRRLGLRPGDGLVDVGCGNGYSTVRLAESFPEWRFTGVDFSENMVVAARELALKAHRPMDFLVGDVRRLTEALGDRRFQVAMTDRCLINLPTPEEQQMAIANIHAHLVEGGHLVSIENFQEGQRAMNEARESVGLEPIPVRWHNLFFDQESYQRMVAPCFEVVEQQNFASSYYFATRVVYAAMCKEQGVEPDYHHPIHQKAVDLPWWGDFSPIRLTLLRKKGA